MKVITIAIGILFFSVFTLSFLFYNNTMNFTVYAQSDLQTTKYRNMVIDLGNGLETNARLNLPATLGTVLIQEFFCTGLWKD